MSGGGTLEGSGRHEPPLIPQPNEHTAEQTGSKPPPIPGAHEPPSVPGRHEPPSIPAATRINSGSAHARPPEVIFEGGGQSGTGAFLSWLALVLAFLSIPCILAAAFSPPGHKWEGLAGGLILSFTATSVAGFAKSQAGKSFALAKLSFRLGFGFLLLAIVAVIAALIQDITALRRWTEGVYRLGQEAYQFLAMVKGLVLNLFHHGSSAAPVPSPTPSPTPAP